MNASQNSNRKSQNESAKVKSSNVKLRAYEFSLKMIAFVNKFPKERAFFAIGDQVIRSSTSIGANLIEAQASSSRREFVKYYEIALKSANETKYWLSLLRDSFDDLSAKAEELLVESTEISKMIGSSVITLKGKRKF